MTIANKLTQINDIKQDIKTALTNKGVDVSNTPFTEYANAISSIVSGGGLPSWIKEYEEIDFTPSEDTNAEKTFEYNLNEMPNLVMVLSDFIEREKTRDFLGACASDLFDSKIFMGYSYYSDTTTVKAVINNTTVSSNPNGVLEATNTSCVFATYSYGGTKCYWRAGHTYKIIVARVGI